MLGRLLVSQGVAAVAGSETAGLLLDTHVQLWLEGKLLIPPDTLKEIGLAGTKGKLYYSDIAHWELGVALGKRNPDRRPDLGGLAPAAWLERLRRRFHVRALGISAAISEEAGLMSATLGYGDPGDCFLIATARVHGLTLVTHDMRILALARRKPDYVSVLAC